MSDDPLKNMLRGMFGDPVIHEVLRTFAIPRRKRSFTQRVAMLVRGARWADTEWAHKSPFKRLRGNAAQKWKAVTG